MEGYKNLQSYILATVIGDLTAQFIVRWIDAKSRTTDQMNQAARSGKQNIAEGYTMQSLEGYIKLCGVAQGSTQELAADYEDFLRQRGFATWLKDSAKVRAFRGFRAFWVAPNVPNTPKLPNDPEEAANMLLTFCHMETYLLSRQIEALKEKFVREGGFRENLFRQRLAQKKTSGFTLVELLVVSGIVVLLAGLMLPSWRQGEGALALERAAAKISQDIERAKDLALQAKWFTCQTGRIAGYGMYFTSNSTSYTIFADCNNNQRYDSGTDGLVEAVEMENAVKISSVTQGAFGMVIVPPDPAVYLKDGAGGTLSSAQIIVNMETGGSNQKTITINQKAVVGIQ